MTRSTAGWEISCWPSSRSPSCTMVSTSRGTPASHSASIITAPLRRACLAGLITTAEPAASAASVEPAGMATGKFHGLADLGVALVDRLAGFAGHDLEQVRAAGLQDVACAVQDLGTFGAGQRTP